MVLATIVHIFTRFVQCDIDLVESVRTFQKGFGDRVTSLALDVCLRNEERHPEADDENDLAKYALSLSIVNFLKSASLAEAMQQCLQSKSGLLKRILITEEVNASERAAKLPCALEMTHLGREVSTLLECFTGPETVGPYSHVCLRLIMRIADLLMGKSLCQPTELDLLSKNSHQIAFAIMEIEAKKYEARQQAEAEFWVDKPKNFFSMIDEEELERMMSQHMCFTHSNGVALLKMLLTSKSPLDEELLDLAVDPNFSSEVASKQSGRDQERPLKVSVEELTAKLEEKVRKNYIPSDDKVPSYFKMRRYRWNKYRLAQRKRANE